MKLKTVGFVAAAALIAGNALAEKAFIPVADGAGGRGVNYRTEVSVASPKGTAEQRLSARLGGDQGTDIAVAQELSLKGGENRLLTNLAGNGLVQLDLPKGMAANATLVVERANGATARVSIPVLTGVDAMSGGSRAMLQGYALGEGFRKISVGVVNLSSKPAKCEASFVDDMGANLFAPVSFTVAAHAERRSGETFGAAKKGVDVDSLSGVRCDQGFFAYALAENQKTGALKVVYPGKEVVLAATTGRSPTGEATAVFQIPGTFLVAGTGHWSFHYNMGFGAATTFHKIALDVDMTVGQWDPKKPSGIHLIWWLQKGPKWGNDLLQYLNGLKSNIQKFRYNYYPSLGTQGGPGVKPGGAYHVHGFWDGPGKKNGYTITNLVGGALYQNKTLSLNKATFTTVTTFIEFAHPNDGPDGPESRAPGWTWSNFRAEFTP